MVNFDYTAETFDARELLARYDFLAELFENDEASPDEKLEMFRIEQAIEIIREHAADHPEDGVTCIRDEFFVDYCRVLIEDWCDEIPKELPDYVAIDWEETAENLRVYYTNFELAGARYWFR